MDCRTPIERRRWIAADLLRETGIDTENGATATVTWAATEQELSA